MIFNVIRKQDLWCVDDPRHEIGGLFVDLASALRFIRQHQSTARILVRSAPSDM